MGHLRYPCCVPAQRHNKRFSGHENKQANKDSLSESIYYATITQLSGWRAHITHSARTATRWNYTVLAS